MIEKKTIMGGEFSISQEMLTDSKCKKTNIYNEYTAFYSSGRCALYAILKDIEHQLGKCEILLPDYLCESVTKTVKDLFWGYHFYHIKTNLHMDKRFLTEGKFLNHKVILLIDYFGMTDLTEDIAFIKSISPDAIIIADCVQAFFSMNKYDADYSFTSFRKWFPCPDGAAVIKNMSGSIIELNLPHSKWAEYKYAGNILKQYSLFVDDSIALELLKTGEKLLEKEYLSCWNESGKNIYFALDFDNISRCRQENAKLLHKELDKLKIKHIYVENTTPLFIPIFITARDKLKKLFASNNIFTPTHWPHISRTINGTNLLYDKELSLICDQRYGIEDMLRQIKILKHFISKGDAIDSKNH